MKDIWNIKHILLSVFFSFEFLLIILIGITYPIKFEIYKEIGKFLFNDNEIIKYISLGLPLVVFVLAIRHQKEILHPYDKNKALYDWENYIKLKISTWIGITWTFLPILPIFIVWMRKGFYEEYDIGFYYILLLIPSVISLISLYLASQKEKEIIEKHL